MILALFDFDGTITCKDSLPDFIQFAVGKTKYYKGLFLMSPMLVAFKLKLIRNDKAKEQLIKYFFSGWDAELFNSVATAYGESQIDRITHPAAIEKINWHLAEGHEVAVVSASLGNWIEPWTKKMGIELISTGLEVVAGQGRRVNTEQLLSRQAKLTGFGPEPEESRGTAKSAGHRAVLISGRFSTPNCHGPEKVRRIKERYDICKYTYIYAYGDSNGDREMLGLATHPNYRVF